MVKSLGKGKERRKLLPQTHRWRQITKILVLDAEQIPGTSKIFAPLENVSEKKLANSSFLQLENTPTKLKKTRVTTAKLSLREYQKQHAATGYKIMDIILLQESLALFAAFAKCKRSSCLKIITDPKAKKKKVCFRQTGSAKKKSPGRPHFIFF